MVSKVLVLGANGSFGTNAKAAFLEAGWDVTSFQRGKDTLESAVEGMDVVVMAQNPGDYSKWQKELLPMHRAVIEAASREGATILLPGNVYVFGKNSPETWDETTPHHATNPLGRLRREVEKMYRAADTQVIVLRCGDFIDVRPSGNWFDRMICKPLAKGRITYPGPLDRPHAWAYLPDAGRAALALAERRKSLAAFEDVPFPGHTLTGHQLAEALSGVTGRRVQAAPFNWLPIHMLKPFAGFAAGVIEMRYLWHKPQRLDDRRFRELLPDFTPTPLPEALRNSTGFLPGMQARRKEAA